MARKRKAKFSERSMEKVLRSVSVSHLGNIVRANLGRKTTELALRELSRRKRRKVGRKKGYVNVMGKWVRVD